MGIHVSSGNVRYGMVANATAWHSVSCWSTINLNNASLSFWWKTTGVALSCMLVCFAFFFTIFVLKYNAGKNVWERDWGCYEKGNVSDVYKEQRTDLFGAGHSSSQPRHIGTSSPGSWGWLLTVLCETSANSWWLHSFQEVSEAGNVFFKKSEALVI